MKVLTDSHEPRFERTPPTFPHKIAIAGRIISALWNKMVIPKPWHIPPSEFPRNSEDPFPIFAWHRERHDTLPTTATTSVRNSRRIFGMTPVARARRALEMITRRVHFQTPTAEVPAAKSFTAILFVPLPFLSLSRSHSPQSWLTNGQCTTEGLLPFL